MLDGRWGNLPLRELGEDEMIAFVRSVPAFLTAVAMTALVLAGCRSTPTPLDERVSYWRANVAKELPIGTRREEIEAWTAHRGVALTYTERVRWLAGNLEDVVVPQEGPCNTWNIGIVVRLDERNRSKKQSVGATKICQVLPP